MARKVVVYDDFSKGEFGTLSNANLGKGWWTGQNVVRATDGTLCPRAGEKLYTLTGVPDGKVGAMGQYRASDGTQYVWVAIGDAVYRFVATNFNSQALSGPYTGSLSGDVAGHVIDGGTLSYHFSTGGIFEIDHAAETVTSVEAGISAHGAVVYGARAVTAQDQTLHLSAPNDFGEWDVANGALEVLVGDDSSILGLAPLRSSLAVAKTGGGVRPWYMVTGSTVDNIAVQQAEVSTTPQRPEQCVGVGVGVGFVTGGDGTIATFDGVRVNELPHLRVTSDETPTPVSVPAQVTTFTLKRRGEWGIVTDNNYDFHDPDNGSIWLFRNGCWTRHRRADDATGPDGAYAVSVRDEGLVVFAQGGGASTKPSFLAWDPYLDRPPFSTDRATVIDPAHVTFSLPEWWDDKGEEVAVRAVIVDFTKWDTGGADNTWSLTSYAMRVDDNHPEDVNGPFTWSEPTSAASATGTRARVTATFAESYGNAFRLRFHDLRGVSITRLLVVLDTRPLSIEGGA